MQVTSATSADRTLAAAPTAGDGTDGTTTVAKKTMLGQDDFLKLLAVQFQQQDPMKPMEDTAFIAQMAQFTALDQTKSMLTQMTQLGSSQGLATANSYLGRQVTLTDANDQTITGLVGAVQVTNGTPQLIVNGTAYPVSSVTRVEPAPVTNSTNNSSSNP
jgi:flagellar basal-body rod modification protein FlgD